jgi:peptide/nickel transport system permease protein
MAAFLLRRGVAFVPTLLGITLLSFLVLNLMPSDPVLTWAGGGVQPSAEALQRLRVELRTDQGPLERYADWLLAVLRGDLGHSIRDGRAVTAVVSEALPWTLILNLCAVAAIYGLAVPFGILGAAAPGSAPDRAGGTLLLLLYAIPSFAAALLLQQVFAVRLHLLPLHGVADRMGAASALQQTADLARHLILPSICLALSGWAFVARYARAAFRSTLGREFLSAARAKGLSRTRAFGHVLANTAVPLVTLLAGIIPGLVGGSVIVEQIFSWPGVGRLYLGAVEARDYPVVLGLTLLSAIAVLAGQFIVDLLYLAVDPRMRDRMLEDSADA